MFNIGFSELVILAVIGLIVIGPEQLPDLARKLAKFINEIRRAKNEIMGPMDDFTNQARVALDRARQKVNEPAENLIKKTEVKPTADNNVSSNHEHKNYSDESLFAVNEKGQPDVKLPPTGTVAMSPRGKEDSKTESESATKPATEVESSLPGANKAATDVKRDDQ